MASTSPIPGDLYIYNSNEKMLEKTNSYTNVLS
jgi:hypothetical protein